MHFCHIFYSDAWLSQWHTSCFSKLYNISCWLKEHGLRVVGTQWSHIVLVLIIKTLNVTVRTIQSFLQWCWWRVMCNLCKSNLSVRPSVNLGCWAYYRNVKSVWHFAGTNSPCVNSVIRFVETSGQPSWSQLNLSYILSHQCL